MTNKFGNIFNEWNCKNDFSGVFSITRKEEKLFQKACGYMNKSTAVTNNINTKFGIASGTKIFTAVAVCQLIEQNKLSFDDKVLDILEFEFPKYNREFTVKHLLTHTSGIPDYFDEEVSDDFEALWQDIPVYIMTKQEDFLPLFQHKSMMFNPGERYSYSNSGFVLLGLLIEKISGQSYQDFVLENIIKPCGLENTGFFRMDMLPENTACGYTYDERLKGWRSNIFSVPIIGGADGGIYTNVQDMSIFWRSLVNRKLLNAELTNEMLSSQVKIEEQGDNIYYGLGVYIIKKNDSIVSYFVVGGDPGVDIFSIYYPDSETIATALGNTDFNTFPLLFSLNKIMIE